ncbi:hypothetical protein E4Z66_01285 [Aliishimia ponticola]|uniref:Uncharacterized protein n=1 Tax=Aliishimia ponticola TaxID=2499833 RepID=A0A4S4NJ26_9RHOB|nr:hypothetical protein [Aliishimia ponticola]THH38238.1 hypothetical protein E4Z66_01285 [Aliishimia ponticola]
MDQENIKKAHESAGVWPIVVLTVVILAGGLAISIASNYDWFSRSGALLIAVLILLYGLDRRKSGGVESEIKLELSEALDEMGLRKLNDYPLTGSFSNEFLPKITKARQFVVAELFSGALATVVWGFGDLVVDKLVGCGQWQC